MAGTSGAMPERILAQVSPRSVGGISLFGAGAQNTRSTCPRFFSDDGLIATAVERLRAAGIEVLYVKQTTIDIAGTQNQYENAFGTKFVIEQREVMEPGQRQAFAEFVESAERPTDGLIPTESTGFADLLEGVAIEEPRYAMQPSAFAQVTDYWRLGLPADVPLGCNADPAHRAQTTGKGVHIVMADSGWFRHPFFVHRGYRVSSVVLGPGASNPDADESGHGTGESASIFSVAPDVQRTPVKMNLVNTVGAFPASDYASGFESEIYTNPPRRVPDLCGLVGMQPQAIYIRLPLEPGGQIDQENSGGNHPNGDEIANNDEWAAFRGISAAAPQLAGAAAFVKQVCPELDPDEVRGVLRRSARDITAGRASSRRSASP